MKARAGLGVDRLSLLDFERLPECAITELVALFTAIEESLTWPWQSLLVIGRFLAKKSGGGPCHRFGGHAASCLEPCSGTTCQSLER
eukprot:52123-Pyramimonas_sp.AAC.1